ncbi:MAG: aldo/keto reductase, partial [Desulfovibrio sp.]|nr:aldo/keto reductase [Desulfovibrio sp.]
MGKNNKGVRRRAMLAGTAGVLGLGTLCYGLGKSGLFSGYVGDEDIIGPVTRNKHPRTGAEVSAFGYGCMRLPMLPNATSPRGTEVDEKKAFELIDYALASGVNYFDSAYFYHKGVS